eukprot:SAG11_NODE_1235_length_5427_cov_12.391892_4_plen_351_part_00
MDCLAPAMPATNYCVNGGADEENPDGITPEDLECQHPCDNGDPDGMCTGENGYTDYSLYNQVATNCWPADDGNCGDAAINCTMGPSDHSEIPCSEAILQGNFMAALTATSENEMASVMLPLMWLSDFGESCCTGYAPPEMTCPVDDYMTFITTMMGGDDDNLDFGELLSNMDEGCLLCIFQDGGGGGLEECIDMEAMCTDALCSSDDLPALMEENLGGLSSSCVSCMMCADHAGVSSEHCLVSAVPQVDFCAGSGYEPNPDGVMPEISECRHPCRTDGGWTEECHAQMCSPYAFTPAVRASPRSKRFELTFRGPEPARSLLNSCSRAWRARRRASIRRTSVKCAGLRARN